MLVGGVISCTARGDFARGIWRYSVFGIVLAALPSGLGALLWGVVVKIAHLSDAAVGYKIRSSICRLSQSRFGGELTQPRESHDGLRSKFLRQFHAALVGRAVGVVEIDVG